MQLNKIKFCVINKAVRIAWALTASSAAVFLKIASNLCRSGCCFSFLLFQKI